MKICIIFTNTDIHTNKHTHLCLDMALATEADWVCGRINLEHQWVYIIQTPRRIDTMETSVTRECGGGVGGLWGNMGAASD